MRALAIVLMLSGCVPRTAYVRGDGDAAAGPDCQRIEPCEDSVGGSGASAVGLGILAVAAAVGVGALIHELASN